MQVVPGMFYKGSARRDPQVLRARTRTKGSAEVRQRTKHAETGGHQAAIGRTPINCLFAADEGLTLAGRETHIPSRGSDGRDGNEIIQFIYKTYRHEIRVGTGFA